MCDKLNKMKSKMASKSNKKLVHLKKPSNGIKSVNNEAHLYYKSERERPMTDASVQTDNVDTSLIVEKVLKGKLEQLTKLDSTALQNKLKTIEEENINLRRREKILTKSMVELERNRYKRKHYRPKEHSAPNVVIEDFSSIVDHTANSKRIKIDFVNSHSASNKVDGCMANKNERNSVETCSVLTQSVTSLSPRRLDMISSTNRIDIRSPISEKSLINQVNGMKTNVSSYKEDDFFLPSLFKPKTKNIVMSSQSSTHQQKENLPTQKVIPIPQTLNKPTENNETLVTISDTIGDPKTPLLYTEAITTAHKRIEDNLTSQQTQIQKPFSPPTLTYPPRFISIRPQHIARTFFTPNDQFMAQIHLRATPQFDILHHQHLRNPYGIPEEYLRQHSQRKHRQMLLPPYLQPSDARRPPPPPYMQATSSIQLPELTANITSDSSNIILTWDCFNTTTIFQSRVDAYLLYAYHTVNLLKHPPKEISEWRFIGAIRVLPLPIACTLTRTFDGHNYFFAVVSIDNMGVRGELSNPCLLRVSL